MNHRILPLQLIVLFLAAPVLQAFAKPTQGVTTPRVGSATRRTILDKFRENAQGFTRDKVVFYGVTIRMKNGWAFITAKPRDSRGRILKSWASGPDSKPSALFHLKDKRWFMVFWSWHRGSNSIPITRMREGFPEAPRSLFPSDPVNFPGDGPTTGDGFNNQD